MERRSSRIDIEKAASFYNNRYDQYGRDIKSVGWGSKEDQTLRFEMLFRGIDPVGKTILDVGCGLGDLLPFLKERTNGSFRYIGIDIAENLIRDAKSTYAEEGREFYSGDIFSVALPEVDIAVLSGALSYNVEHIESYAHDTMGKMFALSREAIAMNFLSTYVDFQLDKNRHFQPEAMFTKAKSLSKRVCLLHDYPLYEFTIQLFKATERAGG